MKSIRHTRIKDIIENKVIETQEELAEELRKKSIDVTQATFFSKGKAYRYLPSPVGNFISINSLISLETVA